MTAVRLVVNGEERVETVEPRMHLADLLREKAYLTGTHLRCEQGVCGACTLLIDGVPARSCLTYAVLCEGAEITTIEGLEDDPVIAALRRAFSAEHGLQCGFCTPAMLITARDIVTRLPHADDARIRLELSGNLCRCTGYVGIVRAVRRVLGERDTLVPQPPTPERTRLGPVGSGHAMAAGHAAPAGRAATTEPRRALEGEAAQELGLSGLTPNIEIHQSFTIARPEPEVWTALDDLERVVPCMPGATLTEITADGRLRGEIAVKLGPISASFSGQGRIVRDEARRRGTLLGAGRDRLSGSRAGAEIDYALTPLEDDRATRVDLELRASIAGPLAQFGRAGIVEDLAGRLTESFARNLEARLCGGAPGRTSAAPIRAATLLGAVLRARLKRLFNRLVGR
jgi:carbon-monoxide dehydrogenase small subunit